MSERDDAGPVDTVAPLAQTVADDDAPAPARPPDGLARGAQVSRYLVVGRLGAGGMGVVYAAYDPELDRKIALKVIRSRTHETADAQGRARMLREAQAIARLQHPNVVAVHDVGSLADDGLFIAMELVDGDTLAAILRQDTRSPAQLLELFVQAGRGLAAAHAAGLIHRDFKPDNVLIGRDGRARVADFGLVREVGRVVDDAAATAIPTERPSEAVMETALTVVGELLGTPSYMAPEQLDDQPVDARTDQYSFCASLFQALAGRLPFEGATLAELAVQVLTAPPPELPAGLAISPRVRAAVLRGLSRDPAARFASMDELLAELVPEPPPAGRRRIAIAGAGALAAVAVAIAVVTLARTHPEPAIHCGDGASRLAGVWDADRRKAVEAAFAATKAPFAPAEIATVTRALDAYGSAWVDSYDDACRATNERGDQSAALLDRRTTCLEARRSELAGVVGVLVSATTIDVARAHATVAGMSPISRCEVTGIASDPEPTDPFRLAVLAQVRDRLSTLAAAADAGRIHDPTAHLEEQLEAEVALARTTGYRPVMSDALWLLGSVQDQTGNVDGAELAFTECTRLAVGAGEMEDATRCALSLAELAAGQHDFETAHLQLLEATKHAESTTPLRRADVAYSRGRVAMGEGKWQAALEAFEQSRLLEEQNGLGGVVHSRSLRGIAEAEDDLGHYKEAREMMERARAISEGDIGPSHPEMANVWITLGNIDADEGDDRAAADAYQRALAIREQLGDQDGAADALNNLGTLAVQDHQLDAALAYFQKALAIRDKLTPDGASVAMILTNIGAVQRGRNDCTGALVTLARSLALAERLGKDHPYVADALANIGGCRLTMHQLPEAQAALERALAIRGAGARPVELADVQFDLARTLWERGERARALALARSAREADATSDATKEQLAEVDAWLAAHPR